MMGETQDRRVARTQRALNDALFGLIQTKDYDRVTVQDIIDKADVGRSTFYAHYATKDELLLSSMSQLTADLDAHLEDASGLTGPVLPVRGLFRHVAAHRPMFGALFSTRAIELVSREAQDMLAARALATIEVREAAGARHAIPKEVRAKFLAGALMAFVTWWLDEDMPLSPDEASDTFDALVASA